MKRREQRPRPPSNLRNELRTYRNEHDLTQEQLSELLEVEARTLRRWENGETLVSDVYELNRIADCLGIPHERLGIVPPITVSREDLETGMQHSWELIQAGYISEARKVAETLVRRSQLSPLWEKKENLFVLARLYYAAAHATNLSVRTEDVDQAIYHYKQMEYFARASGDPSLMNTALVYLGDMYRRKGDVQRAIDYLEGAQTIPLLSPSALGNNLQLLARAYLRAERLQEFDTALKQSEAIAQEITQVDPEMQYHLTHVYEEYAKSFVALGKMQQALDAVELAEKYSPQTKSVEMLLKVARAEALIYGGDIRNGEPLAVEAAIYTREHGHNRRLERIYALKRHISQRMMQYEKFERSLSEALEGPLEI